MIYQTPHFRLLRKPANIPSSWGKEYSFLDGIKDNLGTGIYSKELEDSLSLFGPEREYGLLNRLDNRTTGLLYFAKDEASLQYYRELQAEHKITKHYIADVYGQLLGLFGWIATPLAHHPTDESRMVALTTDDVAYRSQPIMCTSYREKLSYDKELDITTIVVQITKGARHQIRCHLGSIGHPIVNDNLYTTKKQRQKWKKQGLYNIDGILGLMSVGLKY